MTRQQRVRAVLVAAGLGLAATGGAAAQDNGGAYFLVQGGATSYDLSRSDIDQSLLDEAAAAFNTPTTRLNAAAVASTLDDSDTGWGVQVGYRFNRYVAAEFGYVDLGNVVYAGQLQATVVPLPAATPAVTTTIDTDRRVESAGPTASVLGMFPLNERFDIHGRAGIYFGDTRVRNRSVVPGVPASAVSFEVSDSSRDFFAGIGGAWNINNSYSVRVEYIRYLDVGDDRTGEADIDFINVSMLFR
jgi:OmpA-OmpF porin, OOP family